MGNTLNEISNEVYYLLNEPSDSNIYNRSSYVIPKINEVIKQVCKGTYADINGQIIYKGGDMVFLRKLQVYNVKSLKPTTADFSIGAVEIYFDTTDFSSSGYVYINGNIIKYTGKTSSKITGCSNVLIEALSGSNVYQIYLVPTDYYKQFQVLLNNNTEIEYKDFRDTESYNIFYSIIGDYNLGQFILFNIGEYGSYFFRYYYTPDDLVDDSDECVLPDDYGRKVISKIVAGELLFQTEEDQHSMQILRLGYNNLKVMYGDFASLVKEVRPKIKYKKSKYIYTTNY